MKLDTLAALCAAGMALTGGAVYSLTPLAGATPTVSPSSTPEAVPAPTVSAVASDEAHFTAAATLVMEGSLGHRTVLRGPSAETFLLLEVRGAEGGKATVRAPVNLALVIDRSGSMKGKRIVNAVLAATAAVDRLHEGDVVSVVAFDTATQLIVPPTVIDERSRSGVNQAIRGITLGGDTCISCGMEEGMSQLEKTSGKVSRMVVLSDGDATAGVRDVPSFRSLAQRARDKGISISTVGVNVDYNERILGAIAEESNGQHYFVENESALSRAFEAEAEALTGTIASGAEAVIELAPGVELDRVYDRSFRKFDRSIVVPLGTFSRGESKSVLIKVRVSPQGDQTKVARVELSYRDLTTGDPAKIQGDLGVRASASQADVSELDPVVAARLQRSETAATLLEANRLFSQGKLDEARRKLEEQSQRLRNVAAGATRGPAKRAGDVDRDIRNQEDALNRANTRFKPGVGASPQNPFQESAEGKGAVKEANQDSFQMRR